MNPKFKKFQIPMRRAPDGKVLGVFKGIAESLGWQVRWTRVLGVVILLSVAGAFGVEGTHASILAVGFFYLLLGILMRPPLASLTEPREQPAGVDHASAYVPRWENRGGPPPVPRVYSTGRRVDLAQLDRQVDNINRRIQRMETIVTDRQYDWDRRLNG